MERAEITEKPLESISDVYVGSTLDEHFDDFQAAPIAGEK